jgi:hypothetical protein
LVAEPVDAIMVHYVLSGTHFMAVPKQDPVVCSAGSIVLIRPLFALVWLWMTVHLLIF